MQNLFAMRFVNVQTLSLKLLGQSFFLIISAFLGRRNYILFSLLCLQTDLFEHVQFDLLRLSAGLIALPVLRHRSLLVYLFDF